MISFTKHKINQNMDSKMQQILEMQKEVNYIKTILHLMKENDRLKKQTGNLFDLMDEAILYPKGYSSKLLTDSWMDVIDALIETNGEEYVKEVFAEDYEKYKEIEQQEEEEEESEEELNKSFMLKYGEKEDQELHG